MARFHQVLVRRMILLIPVLFGVSIITFTISHVFQDPVWGYINPANYERISDEQIERIREQHGLNRPLVDQYLFYVRDLIFFDWGYTTVENRPVLDAIRDKFPATLELTIVAMVLSLAIGIPIGILSATRKDQSIDHASRFVALSGVSIPVFWLGLMMQLFIGYYFKPILAIVNLDLPLNSRTDTLIDDRNPITHYTGLNLIDSILNLNIEYLFDTLKHLVMPAIALSWISMALFARMMRTSMLETIKQDYITLARAKGLSERVVIYKHALRNAIIPTLTVAGLSFAGLLGGAVLTETVFSWPGLGRWAAIAILQTDANAVIGFTVFVAIIYVSMNLLVDVLYTLVDPRISLN